MKYSSRLLAGLTLMALLCGGVARGQTLAPRVVPEAPGNGDRPAPSNAGALSVSAAGGVGWEPMAQGLPGRVLTTAVLNDDLYAIVETPDPSRFGWWQTGLYKWDGFVWTALRISNMESAINSLVAYRGELYLGGGFTTVDNVPGFKGIAKWNGSGWVPVVGGALDQCTMASVYNLNVLDDKIYCAGEFTMATRSTAILQYDGTTVSEVGTFPGFPNDNYMGGTGTALYKGDLYLSGGFDAAGGYSSLARWDGTAWSPVQSWARVILRIATFNDQIYCYGAPTGGRLDVIKSWDGTAWHDVGLPSGTENVMDYQIYHGDLYISTLGSSNVVARLKGSDWEVVGSFDNDVYDMESFRDRIFASGWFTLSNDRPNTPLNHVALFCDDGQCGTISGAVYNDLDGDCAKGDHDYGMSRRMIEILPGPIYTMTHDDGTYDLPLSPGSYTVGLVPRIHWNQNCPAANGTHSVTIASADDAHEDISFGMSAAEQVEDIGVSMVAERARPGRPFLYCITYENNGTIISSGTIRLLLDPTLTFVSSEPPTTRSDGRMLEWDFTDLKPGELRTIKVEVMVPQSAPVGMPICSDVSFEPYVPLYGLDDRDTVCVEVTGSYDPNDITVRPHGDEGDGVITTADSVLTYTVRFQNTGNDTAFRVVVIDTVSSDLDIRSLRLGAASHGYTFNIVGANTLVWTFDDIMLPQKASDEPGSHGMFKYSLRQKPGLASGTAIPNRASIYFDYNAPVVTNTIYNVIGGALAVPEEEESVRDGMIYPNPARGEITIASELPPGSVVQMRDLLGRVVLEHTADGAPMRLDVRSLPAGAYFVMIPSGSGAIVRRVTVVR